MVVEGLVAATAEDWLSLPIYRLPALSAAWSLPRAEAKALAKALAAEFGTAEVKKKGTGAGSLSKGMPKIKPGKSRRHGGYGIG